MGPNLIQVTQSLSAFTGGRAWVEDENGDAAEVNMKTKVRSLIGFWHDVHDKPITFDVPKSHNGQRGGKIQKSELAGNSAKTETRKTARPDSSKS